MPRFRPNGRQRSLPVATAMAFVVGALAATSFSHFFRPHSKLALEADTVQSTAGGEPSLPLAQLVIPSRALGAAVPPPRMAQTSSSADRLPQNHSQHRLPEPPPLRGAPLAFLSFSNAAYLDFLLNWAHGMSQLGVPYLVAAFDNDTAAACQQHGIPHHDLQLGDSTSFRGNLTQFQHMGSLKVGVVLSVLEKFQVGTVVVSDTDTVWLSDPSDYFALHPAADWLISTDCLSHQVEVEWQPHHNQPRCGHVPGNNWGRAFNTGVFAVRNRPPALEVLRRWRDFLEEESRTQHWFKLNEMRVDDQLALNLVLEEGMGYIRAVPEDSRTVWAANDTLRLHPLPVVLFPGGHVAFVQRLPWAQGVTPYVIHSTFDRYSQQSKRGRFREFGVWFVDEPEYYEGQYLQYDNDVLNYISDLVESRHNGSMAPLYKHLVAASYQLALFRDALAIARLTNRTLILPNSWCWCDYDETPHVLETCRIRGTHMRLPFQCPADFIFHVHRLDDNKQMHYRMPGFLDLPQVPSRIRNSRRAVHVVPKKPREVPVPQEGVGHAAEVWPGITSSELLQLLTPVAGAAVLDIRGMRPGLFGSFADEKDNVALDDLYTSLTVDSNWCCAARDAKPSHTSFQYELPRPLQEGWQPWEPFVLEPLTWCNEADVNRGTNADHLHYPNHPCQFLTNATAAAIAARIT